MKVIIYFFNIAVSMALDVEPKVQVKAVELVTTMLRYQPEHLAGPDYESVYRLVSSQGREVARAAGKFLTVKMLDQDLSEASSIINTGQIEKKNHGILLVDLVDFFIESQLPEHVAYLVDSLIGINPILLDWSAMTQLLTIDRGALGEGLQNVQETILIEIMSS